jgi:aryl-alcohol dehydrogenase-like predicted oxidoreductase
MKFRALGRTGLRVSEIGHGLWGIGDWTGGDLDEYEKALDESVSLGCNFFDSAWAYGNGESDRILGRLIKRHGDKQLIAASKVPPENMVFPAAKDAPYDAIFPEKYVVDTALRIRDALGVETIDLLQFHLWEDAWADSAWAETIGRLKQERIIRFFGLSLNRWEPWNGVNAIGSGNVDVVQVIYNVFDQAPEDELFPLCEEFDVGVIARVPLDEGSLGGKMARATTFLPEDWRAKYFCDENLLPTLERVEVLKGTVPKEMSLPEMALRFILTNRTVSTTIVGMRTVEHVKENIRVADGIGLSPRLLEELREHRWDREVTPWAN